MTVLFFLIPLTLILLAFAVWAFFWAVRNDQFDDLEGPAYRILFDDDENDLPIDQRSQNPANAEPDNSDEPPIRPSENPASKDKHS
ncbi:cbb3-type cytochrome oxidase assembly protein CcoS [Halomonas halocynthiae]|uniref:cbb3-type cytochrome oxidase assembly protein CcoS n=1 Tax=Halomonas halocynthiae TaxID=176290 RepID=UPI00040D3869|nr:cbb3-type cytochrome oxidase assembly protein CcoS [Halomonas halocynthiae]